MTRSDLVSTRDLHATWWRQSFDNSEHAEVICDRSGRVLESNRSAQRLLGLPEPDGVAALFRALDCATAERLRGLLKRLHDQRQTLGAVRLTSPDGTVLVVDLLARHLGDTCVWLTIIDASVRWRMESHLQRLITAIDAARDVFFLTDATFGIVFANAAFQTQTGYPVEETLGKAPDFFRAPGEAARLREGLLRVRAGKDWSGELLNIRADSSTYPVSATISPVHDKSGVFLGCVAFERDITSHRRLQHELVCERDFARSILDSLESAIYAVDRDFRLTHFNGGWRSLPKHHGWLEMIDPQPGDMLLDFVPDEKQRARLRDIFQSALATGDSTEFQMTTPAGQQCFVKVSPLRQHPEVVGLIYHVTDQTRLHQLQQQLYHAQKMETVGALAAGVAHDFNNLLQAIQGNVSFLLDHPGTAPFHPPLRQIEHAVERGTGMSRQLLSFSRAADEHITVLDLNRLVEETSQLVRRLLKNNVALVLRLAPDPLRVRMDATRASQIILNLCVNAQDAMPEGGQLNIQNTVTRLTPEQAARAERPLGTAFAKCAVSDTGSGIPSEILPRIFDPFFTTKRNGQGTGLGLSIAYSVVSQAGGFIEVSSQLGQGSTFEVYLPMIDAPLTVESHSTRPPALAGKGRVLIVEDMDLVRDVAHTFFAGAGFQVLLAKDGKEALEVLARETTPVDLMFSDYNMPGMNGIDLIETASKRCPAMTFILTSGYLAEAERAWLKQRPDVRVLEKPYKPVEAIRIAVDLTRLCR